MDRTAPRGISPALVDAANPVDDPVDEAPETVEVLANGSLTRAFGSGRDLNPRASGYEPTVKPLGVMNPADSSGRIGTNADPDPLVSAHAKSFLISPSSERNTT